MTELETLQRAKMYMEKLANGINPIDESVIPDEDIVNNVRLSRCFFYVADVLQQVIDNGGIGNQKRAKKAFFDLPVERRGAFAFSDVPITISEILKRINALILQGEMRQLTTTAVTQWLESIGVLAVVQTADGRSSKRPTAQGVGLGIFTEVREGMNGPYTAVLYNVEAQRFILDNLDAVIQGVKEKEENQGKPWSDEQDRQLTELYRQNFPIKEIAARLKRNSAAIRARLKKLNLLEG